MVKKFLTFVALCTAIILNTNAETSADAIASKKQTLFSSVNHSSTPYRIPAIATLNNGTVLAIADQRPCGNDVGHGEVDIYAKVGTINADGSYSWNPATNDPSANGGLKIADGTSSNGYGDAAVVVDRESGKVLVICVSGKVVFSNGSSSKHNNMARIVGSADGLTWEKPQDVSDAFFKNLLPNAYTMFMASGRMIQSQFVRVGSYYRIYGALLVKESSGNNNYVVYSDDFGASWTVLGGAKAVSSGDEAKVEELPNGDIVISSRTSGGRKFNVFKFSDKNNATGSWGSATTRSFAGSNSTNGELLFYKGLVDANGTEYNVMFQSLPTGSSREKVSVYYKAFATDKSSWAVSDFTSGWTKGIEVDNGASAYSTMTILPNGQIGFLYEDDYSTVASGGYSNIIYVPLTVEEITGGAYTLPTSVVNTVAEPVITPNGGNILDTQNITLSCATEGAAIYYTTNGTEPTASSTLYTAPFTLSESATVKAIAVKEDYDNSQVVTVNFNVTKAGTTYRFKNVQKNGTCYYFTYDATDGIGLTTNVEEAATYVIGEGTTAGTCTYQTADGNYLIFSGRNLSDENNRGYNSGKGFLTSYESEKCDLTVEKMVAGGNVESFTGEYYTIKGQREFKKDWTTSTAIEQAYFVIKSDGKFDGATAPYYNSNYSSAFVIEEVINEPVVKDVATPVINPAGGEVEEGTTVTISCPTDGATIYYTTDGTEPTTASAKYTGAITVNSAMTIKAIAVKDGYTDSEVASASYTIKKVVIINEYTVVPGTGNIDNSEYYLATFSTTEATVAPAGVKVFYVTANDNDDNITLMQVADGKAIPAGEGVILKASTPDAFKMTSAIEGTPKADLSGNRLKGTCDAVDFTFDNDYSYALVVKGSGALQGQFAFSKVSAGRTLSNYNNRAYLDLSSSKAFSNNFRLSFGGITGIEPVVDEETEAVIFDLSGRRVTEMEPGNIYIINGKKVLKK